MWNSFNTAEYSGMIAETIRLRGYGNDPIHAYYSRPLGTGHFPSIVLIPHMPGWDEWCRETARRFTEHGYAVLCPDIYSRFGSGTAPEVAKRAMEEGGVHDESVMGDVQACINHLKEQPNSNEKVGVIGMCSGGRHTFMAACSLTGIDAAVDCWGGGVIMSPEQLSPARPVSPIDNAKDLKCPLLGIFGNDDKHPDPQEVDKTEEVLKLYEKNYEFHRYDGAGHGFWYYDKAMYRQEQAMDSFNKVIAFFDQYLK